MDHTNTHRTIETRHEWPYTTLATQNIINKALPDPPWGIRWYAAMTYDTPICLIDTCLSVCGILGWHCHLRLAVYITATRASF